MHNLPIEDPSLRGFGFHVPGLPKTSQELRLCKVSTGLQAANTMSRKLKLNKDKGSGLRFYMHIGREGRGCVGFNAFWGLKLFFRRSTRALRTKHVNIPAN